MKKITVLAILMIITAQAFQAQTAYKEKRQVSGFDEVSFALAGEVYINLGSGYSVELEGDRGYLSEVITEVDGDNLKIKTEKWFNTGNKKVIVRITMPSLDGMKLSGSGRMTVDDPLRGDELEVVISGSGKAFLRDVALGEVECSISGSGSLYIAGNGTIGDLEISISGSGDLRGEETRIDTLEARISGSGSCDCHVEKMLRASISGSGDIRYSGNPKIDAKVSGSGRVRMR
ncbi:MAG: DUF2807 domain-containing protein [Bacteroidales bacterium]|nr:DUF2807 domain-containing protein [Bacteroidales bacterium]